jgi:hypothetical protein
MNLAGRALNVRRLEVAWQPARLGNTLLGIGIHFLSSFAGIAILFVMPPTVKIDDTTSVALDFLYAGTVSAVIELATSSVSSCCSAASRYQAVSPSEQST